MGSHVVSCHGRGDMISRHGRIWEKIISKCSGALLSPICEHKNSLPDNNSRLRDILLPVWNSGQPAALDVIFTSPLQSSFIINASEKSGSALSATEERKYEQYSQKCFKVGFQFIPLAFESFWGLSETVRKTLKGIATLADNRSFQLAGLALVFSRLSQSVSATAVRGSVIMLLASEIVDTNETRANLWNLIPAVKRRVGFEKCVSHERGQSILISFWRLTPWGGTHNIMLYHTSCILLARKIWMQVLKVLPQTTFFKKEASVIPLVIRAELFIITMIVYEPRFHNCKFSFIKKFPKTEKMEKAIPKPRWQFPCWFNEYSSIRSNMTIAEVS